MKSNELVRLLKKDGWFVVALNKRLKKTPV
jgi:hypothetical protein